MSKNVRAQIFCFCSCDISGSSKAKWLLLQSGTIFVGNHFFWFFGHKKSRDSHFHFPQRINLPKIDTDKKSLRSDGRIFASWTYSICLILCPLRWYQFCRNVFFGFYGHKLTWHSLDSRDKFAFAHFISQRINLTKIAVRIFASWTHSISLILCPLHRVEPC